MEIAIVGLVLVLGGSIYLNYRLAVAMANLSRAILGSGRFLPVGADRPPTPQPQKQQEKESMSEDELLRLLEATDPRGARK